jgi:hypothetical protein
VTLLTIFSTPKPFTDPHIATIQRNAIQSWIKLGADSHPDEVSALLIGEEDGQADVAAEYGILIQPQVRRNEAGTPLVSSIFELARQASDSPFLAYVNADILLMDDLVQATRQIANSLPVNPFLLIGQRWDLDVREPLDFSPGWQSRLRSEVSLRGQLHRPAGSDYFVFPRRAFTDIPDFAIGRAGWDNWMIYHARQQGWPVIDGTPSVMIVHQNHDYGHLPNGKPHYDLEESQENLAIAGGLANMYMVLDTNQQLVNGRLRAAPFTLVRTIRALERWIMPEDGSLHGLQGRLARRLRRMRRRLA